MSPSKETPTPSGTTSSDNAPLEEVSSSWRNPLVSAQLPPSSQTHQTAIEHPDAVLACLEKLDADPDLQDADPDYRDIPPEVTIDIDFDDKMANAQEEDTPETAPSSANPSPPLHGGSQMAAASAQRGPGNSRRRRRKPKKTPKSPADYEMLRLKDRQTLHRLAPS